MNNRLKINLIKERTLQRKNELEGKQNTESPFFASNSSNNSNNNSKVFSNASNQQGQFYQNYTDQFPSQNVDNNLLNSLNVRPVTTEGQDINSLQNIGLYQTFAYQQPQQLQQQQLQQQQLQQQQLQQQQLQQQQLQQQQLQQQQLQQQQLQQLQHLQQLQQLQQQQLNTQFSSNVTDHSSNAKQQRQKAIATLRKRVEKSPPVETSPNLLNAGYTNNNPLQNMDQNLFDRTSNGANMPFLTLSNGNSFDYNNSVATTTSQTYTNSSNSFTNSTNSFSNNSNFMEGASSLLSQQNTMVSPPALTGEPKNKLDSKNPLAILSRRVEKSKMDHQDKNKMEMMDQRKQSLQILKSSTNERMYNNNNNNNSNNNSESKSYELFQQHKNNNLFTPPNYSPNLGNSVNNGFKNTNMYSNQMCNIERNDSYSSTGSSEITPSAYDQYNPYSMNSRVPMENSHISPLMLPDSNNMPRYSSLSSRFNSNGYMEEPQLFNGEYKPFTQQMYYQQQSIPNSSKSIIPSQRVPAQRGSSLSYSQEDIPQLGAIGNPVNKSTERTSQNNNTAATATATINTTPVTAKAELQNVSSPTSPTAAAEPDQKIRQIAINTLLRRVKNNPDNSPPNPTSPSQRMTADNIYNNNTKTNKANFNNPYGTLNHYDYNNNKNNDNSNNKNNENEEESVKKHNEIRKNLFAKLNNRINTAKANDHSDSRNTSPSSGRSTDEAMSKEEKSRVRKSVMNILGLRTKKNEMENEKQPVQEKIVTVPFVPFKRKFICKTKVNQILNLAMAKKRYLFVFNDVIFLCKGIREDHVAKYQIKNIIETKKLRFAMRNDDTILEEQFLDQNSIIKSAVNQFSVNPIKSLRSLFQQKLLHCSSVSIALFLHCMPGINKRQLGFFIGMPEHNDILEAYINAIPCCNVRLDTSLKLFLKTIRLPSDNDIVNRLLCCFAKIWHRRNENVVTFDYITTLRLVFTLISLNAELHPPLPMEDLEEYRREENMEKIKQSFFNRFKNNDMVSEDEDEEEEEPNTSINTVRNYYMNEQSYLVPLSLLQEMYESIYEEKIEVAPDNVTLSKNNNDLYKVTFSYIPIKKTNPSKAEGSTSTTTTTITSTTTTTPLEFPTKLYQNEISGVVTVTLPHTNPFLQICIHTQDLKVSPSVLTFADSNQAQFTVTATKSIGRKLVIFSKHLTEAATQLSLATQRSILDSYANIDSKCVRVIPAFMRYSIIFETLDGSDNEKPSGLRHSGEEESRQNLKKYIFTLESRRKVQEFINVTKDVIGKTNESSTTTKGTPNESGTSTPTGLQPPSNHLGGREEPNKLISRTNSHENFSEVMYSDDINMMNEEDQEFMRLCNEPVSPNVLILREHFLPNGKKFNTIGRSISALKIADSVATNDHSKGSYEGTVNNLGQLTLNDIYTEYSTHAEEGGGGGGGEEHEEHENGNENGTEYLKPPRPTITTEEIAYEEDQLIDIVLNKLVI